MAGDEGRKGNQAPSIRRRAKTATREQQSSHRDRDSRAIGQLILGSWAAAAAAVVSGTADKMQETKGSFKRFFCLRNSAKY